MTDTEVVPRKPDRRERAKRRWSTPAWSMVVTKVCCCTCGRIRGSCTPAIVAGRCSPAGGAVAVRAGAASAAQRPARVTAPALLRSLTGGRHANQGSARTAGRRRQAQRRSCEFAVHEVTARGGGYVE